MRFYIAAIIAVVFLIPPAAGAQTAAAGKIVASTGKVEARREGGQWAQVGILDPVFQAQTIKTGSDARVKLLMTDQSVIMIGENSELDLSEYIVTPARKSSIVTVFKGRLMAIISKIATGDRLVEFRTPTAVAGVRGTFLAMDVTDDEGKTEIMVVSGQVTVKNILDPDGAGVDIGPGLMTTVMPGVQPSPPVPFDVEKFRSFSSSLKQSLMTGQQMDVKSINTDILTRIKPPQPKEQSSQTVVSSLTQPPQPQPPVQQEQTVTKIPVPVQIKVNMPNASTDESKVITGK